MRQDIVQTLDWLNMDRLLGYAGKRLSHPAQSCVASAHAFVAKGGFEQTAQLRGSLAVNTVLRNLLSFESNRPLLSRATSNRVLAEFARTGLAAKA